MGSLEDRKVRKLLELWLGLSLVLLTLLQVALGTVKLKEQRAIIAVMEIEDSSDT